jgi:hypothetical protein
MSTNSLFPNKATFPSTRIRIVIHVYGDTSQRIIAYFIQDRGEAVLAEGSKFTWLQQKVEHPDQL